LHVKAGVKVDLGHFLAERGQIEAWERSHVCSDMREMKKAPFGALRAFSVVM
jgi:hypothetical protein